MHSLKIAIHVHTNWSDDSDLSLPHLIAAARREGVDCVAVTDHDTVDGALELRRLGEIDVIVGEEISTADGHVIGLFLCEEIPPALPAARTAELIHAQGGLVLVPHPFNTLCSGSVGPRAAEWVKLIDAVEVCNAQNPLPWHDRRAELFARQHALLRYVGSDTHLAGRLAPAWQLMAPFSGSRSFLDSLSQATLHSGRHSLAYMATMAKRMGWAALTGCWPASCGAAAPKPLPTHAQRSRWPGVFNLHNSR